MLDHIAEGLLRKIRFDRRDPVWKYLGEVARDQGAMLQLTPEGIDMFDAAVADDAGIDYSCVVAGVPKPREEFKLKALMDPEYLTLRALFRLLHALTAQSHPHYPYPKPSKATQRLLDRGLGFKVTPGISDGIVPTLSQVLRPAAACRAGRSPRCGRALHAGERTYRRLAALGRRLHARRIRGHLGGGRGRDRKASPNRLSRRQDLKRAKSSRRARPRAQRVTLRAT